MAASPLGDGKGEDCLMNNEAVDVVADMFNNAEASGKLVADDNPLALAYILPDGESIASAKAAMSALSDSVVSLNAFLGGA
jgi:hypothetical protein